jgi:hypothetical protein
MEGEPAPAGPRPVGPLRPEGVSETLQGADGGAGPRGTGSGLGWLGTLPEGGFGSPSDLISFKL